MPPGGGVKVDDGCGDLCNPKGEENEIVMQENDTYVWWQIKKYTFKHIGIYPYDIKVLTAVIKHLRYRDILKTSNS